MVFKKSLVIAALLSVGPAPLGAQQSGQPPRYGVNITQEQAGKAMDAAIAEATKSGWRMSVAIVNTAGDLVRFTQMDDASGSSILLSQRKARSAVLYKRPTKFFSDALAKGATFYLTFPEVLASEGGVPILNKDGSIIGAIGTSGATGPQDGVVSEAGIAALK